MRLVEVHERRFVAIKIKIPAPANSIILIDTVDFAVEVRNPITGSWLTLDASAIEISIGDGDQDVVASNKTMLVPSAPLNTGRRR